MIFGREFLESIIEVAEAVFEVSDTPDGRQSKPGEWLVYRDGNKIKVEITVPNAGKD